MRRQLPLRASRYVICSDSLIRFPDTLKISHPCMSEISALPPSCPDTFDMERLQPKVIIGDTSQAIMSSEYIPDKSKHQPIGELRYLAFCDILRYVMPFTSHHFRNGPLWQVIAHSALGVRFESRPCKFGHPPTIRVGREMPTSLYTMAGTKEAR